MPQAPSMVSVHGLFFSVRTGVPAGTDVLVILRGPQNGVCAQKVRGPPAYKAVHNSTFKVASNFHVGAVPGVVSLKPCSGVWTSGLVQIK